MTPSTRDTQNLQARTLARLATYADGYDVPVLATRSKRDTFAEPVKTAADHHLGVSKPGWARGLSVTTSRPHLSRRRRRILSDDVRLLATVARSTRCAGRYRTNDHLAVDSRQCGYWPHHDRRDDLDGGESSARCMDCWWSWRAIAMGRTNPTYRDALRAIEDRWQDFRRGPPSTRSTRF